MTLIKNKHFLHIINETVSVIDLSRDILYTYKYREIITSNMNDSYNYSTWRNMTVYYIYNTFNLRDYLEPDI